MKNTLNPAFLSHSQEAVLAYQKDPLVHQKITPSFFFEMEKAIKEVTHQNFEMKIPLLFQIPEEDWIADKAAAIHFYESLTLEKKKLILYPNFYHESFQESQKEIAFKDLEQWIISHSS
jgi:alpha-beta hydrolase superfamily lysophospholipase